MSKLHKLLENTIETISFMKIVVSPLLVALFIGIVIYANKTDTLGLMIGVIVTLAGLIAGILLALWTRKNGGASEFNSRVNASPDIDEMVREKKTKK